jgi:hypothetical protein
LATPQKESRPSTPKVPPAARYRAKSIVALQAPFGAAF